MVISFLESLKAPLDALRLNGLEKRAELRAPGGVPDFVLYHCVSGSIHYVIAIEFKLSNWRRALLQAFRYRNFANESYVILDRAHAARAIDTVKEFREANIGLITINTDGVVEAIHYPEPTIPFSEYFSRIVAQELVPTEENTSPDFPFTRTARGGVALSQLRTSLGITSCN